MNQELLSYEHTTYRNFGCEIGNHKRGVPIFKRLEFVWIELELGYHFEEDKRGTRDKGGL